MSNSLTSIAASGGVILTTLALPAILSRLITSAEYSLYATVMSVLPLLALVPQSLRTGAGSALLSVYRERDVTSANQSFSHFVVLLIFFVLFSGLVLSELYIYIYDEGDLQSNILRFGMYCIIVNVIGIAVALIITGPAAANNDFLPENTLKIFPPIIQLIGFFIIYIMSESDKIYYVLIASALNSWATLLVIVYLFRERTNSQDRKVEKIDDFSSGKVRNALSSFHTAFQLYGRLTASISWWNLTAFLSTTASVAIVAFFQPTKIVSFSIAMSVIGVISGGLIAISSPIASKVATLGIDKISLRKELFQKLNTIFIGYIIFSSLFILLVPSVVFRIWVGDLYAEDVQYYVLLLLPAYCLRLLTMCFTVFIMSSGRQSTIWLSPAVESVVATVGGLILIGVMGVEGIAVALFVSSVVRILLTLMYDINLNSDVLPLSAGDIVLPKPKAFFR